MTLPEINKKPLSVTVSEIRPADEAVYFAVVVRRYGHIRESAERPDRDSAFAFAAFLVGNLVKPIDLTK